MTVLVDEVLPQVQLCTNIKHRHRPGSTAFSLMYARQMNRTTDDLKEGGNLTLLLSIQELQKKAEVMSKHSIK